MSGAYDADFGFTGHYHLQPSWMSTGMNLTLFRVYDPELDRWLSRDPVGENGGLNLYGYVENDPVASTDSLGLCVSYRNKQMADLVERMRKIDPAFDAMMKQLEDSSNLWNFDLPENNPDPRNQGKTGVASDNEWNAQNGPGTGGTVYADPTKPYWADGDGVYNSDQVYAHEVRHAADADGGKLDRKPIYNGIPNAEVRASKAQNDHTRKAGSGTKRRTYGGKPLPKSAW